MRIGRRARLLFGCIAALTVMTAPGCATRELPPLPEALVIVDTDMPVPLAVARLRVDLFDERGGWFDSRDVARPAPEDWPVSFGVFSEDTSRTTIVHVRLRAYPEGRVRDYRGERFVDWGGALAPSQASASGVPRLVASGIDRTPSQEPEPLVTIDRVVSVRLEPDRRGAIRVVLAGACVGTMAKLGPAPASDTSIDVAGLETCTASEKEREPVVPIRVDPDRTLPATRAGAWGAEGPCAGGDDAEATATRDARVCVPSGVVILGDRSLLVTPYIASTPERTFRISRFWVDRHEVSGGRFRDAVSRGFVPPEMPTARDAPLGETATDTCSWSTSPMGREELPVTCLTWRTARAYCMFQGGDLLTEAQWEYLATTAGRRFETMYPWGDDDPPCERAVYERLPGQYEKCTARGVGPEAVTALGGDVNPLGVMGLGGNVSEWVRDGFQEYGHACWSGATVTDPVCDGPDKRQRVLRGGSWVSPQLFVRAPMRQGHQDLGQLSFEGARCAYASR